MPQSPDAIGRAAARVTTGMAALSAKNGRGESPALGLEKSKIPIALDVAGQGRPGSLRVDAAPPYHRRATLNGGQRSLALALSQGSFSESPPCLSRCEYDQAVAHSCFRSEDR